MLRLASLHRHTQPSAATKTDGGDDDQPFGDWNDICAGDGKAEERRYSLRYRDKDVPVGEYSDVYVVTTGA